MGYLRYWDWTPSLEGPSIQDLRFLVPTTMQLVEFGTRDLKSWVLGPSGKRLSAGRAADLRPLLKVRPPGFGVDTTKL